MIHNNKSKMTDEKKCGNCKKILGCVDLGNHETEYTDVCQSCKIGCAGTWKDRTPGYMMFDDISCCYCHEENVIKRITPTDSLEKYRI
jgi:hypothetical protein